MNLSEEKVSHYIEAQVQSALSKNENELGQFYAEDSQIVIDGKKYKMNCWVENIAEGKLFVVEVSKKKFFFLKHVQTMGMLISDTGRTVVDQTSMWDLGLG